MTEKEEKNLGGRPTIYSPELAAEICDRLAHGESLRSICRDDDMPNRSTVIRWAYENIGEVKDDAGVIVEAGFSDQYERSRNVGLDIMAEDLLDIADEKDEDWIEITDKQGNSRKVLNKEAVMRSRLRVDTRKWYLSKMAPKRYGNERTIRHQQLDADGQETDPAGTEVNIGVDEIAKAVHAELQASLKRQKEEEEDES